jgi:site-specific DNA-cytosine methylase
MRLLELFCGTKSVSKAVKDKFSEIISVDIEPKFSPTICTDILLWNYKVYPVGHFDVIWASPPCQEYSCLNHSRPTKIPNIAHSDLVVQRTIEIIEYFNPDKFFIENPQTGCLKDREFMLGLPYIDVDYCRFSDWGYKKRTRIWTSCDLTSKLCEGPGVCPNMNGKAHKKAIGNRAYDEFWAVKGKRLEQRYSIPARVILYLFD